MRYQDAIAPEPPTTQELVALDLDECSDVLFYLEQLQPLEGFYFQDGASMAIRHDTIRRWVRVRIERATDVLDPQPAEAA